jgi:molybdate transport system substrate-binding protein
MIRYLFLLIFSFSYLFSSSIVVLSAANLKFFFSDLIQEYNKQFPDDKVEVEFDSSGNITKQILSGKKYDIFLAANMAYPQKVFDFGKAATVPRLYTTGSLILLISSHKGLATQKLNILKDEKIKEITIANKKEAPYGMAAIEALKKSELYDKVKDRLFYSTDASNIIGDVLWYGHAGILPKSAINFLPRGYNIEGVNYIEIDQELYTPIQQGFVTSKDAHNIESVKRFTNFILNDAQKIFKQNGYK